MSDRYVGITTPDMSVLIKELLALGKAGAEYSGSSTFKRGNILFVKVKIPADLEFEDTPTCRLIGESVINVSPATVEVKGKNKSGSNNSSKK